MAMARDSVTIDIEKLISSFSDPAQSKPKIFEVDDRLRQVKAEDYEPKILAIGPIHRGKDQIRNMEKHKVRYLQQLLKRRKLLTIDKFVKKLREREESTRQCYSPALNIETDEFVKMLLLDGCFVIELLRKYFSDDTLTDKDPILDPETLSQIRHDLMLFENQLPFSVLNMLFDMTRTDNPDDNLCRLVVFLVSDMFPWPDVLDLNSAFKTSGHADHLLGLVYRCFIPFPTKIPSILGPVYRCFIPFPTKIPSKGKHGRKGKKSPLHIGSASELKEAGVRLQRSKENRLTFKAGVLKLPPLQVSGNTGSLLRNLIAYEQLRLDDDDDDRGKHVTDYAFFMHCLIRSSRDVEILRRSGILSNYLGGDDKIYQMFDTLGTNFLRSSDFCYSDICKRLNSHCDGRREKYMAKLWRDYFNSPWSLLSFIAAVMLLGISITQLVFSVLTYKHKKDVVKFHLT